VSEFTDAFERGMQGMIGVSSGSCPGCEKCMEGYATADAHRKAWERGETPESPTFSWSACGVCGTTLGGDRSVWHWIDPNDPKREINHEHDMCTDCVLFHANGDEPESWRKR